ncbi:glycosyltransferase family 2 protein [Teredinibacter waterburyi]|uniref:glycosyltransferase family 2 protein n=1 Tax=Teredinibacter waterburyi TaxID=1500538 RepID=UPI00165F0FD5|nr:glycosyltransferase family 2 protein [Teredinibacter waterburyi]
MLKVSIIIAVYNGKETLEKAITSCLEQTYRNKELIIIDGGSTDGTQSILEKYNNDITFWKSEKDRGIYHAWNKAIQHVTGEWLCFIGADDYWAYPKAIEDLIFESQKTGAELVSGKVVIIDSQHNVKRIFGKPWSWKAIKRHHCIAHPGMMHHKVCFERNGSYDEGFKIAGDYDFSLRLGQKTTSSFIDRNFVCMGDSGISHTQIEKTLSEVRDIQAKHPDIGALKANINYIRTRVVVTIKNILGFF